MKTIEQLEREIRVMTDVDVLKSRMKTTGEWAINFREASKGVILSQDMMRLPEDKWSVAPLHAGMARMYQGQSEQLWKECDLLRRRLQFVEFQESLGRSGDEIPDGYVMSHAEWAAFNQAVDRRREWDE